MGSGLGCKALIPCCSRCEPLTQFPGRRPPGAFAPLIRASLDEALAEFSQRREARGELVLVVEGAQPQAAAADAEDLERKVRRALEEGASTSAAARAVALELGVSRSAAYSIALAVRGAGSGRSTQGPHSGAGP